MPVMKNHAQMASSPPRPIRRADERVHRPSAERPPYEREPRMREWTGDPNARLMLRAREGDRNAFAELFERYRAPMVSFAMRYLPSGARAEELVQDAFLQMFQARRSYEIRARFATYAYRVVLNLCLNELRRVEYHRRTESLENPGSGEERWLQIPGTAAQRSDEAATAGELAARIREALGKLPENQRRSLLMTHVEGLSQREVADALSTSTGAVKSLVFRATRALREDLRDAMG